MMIRCDQIHEWLEQMAEEPQALPREVQEHVAGCAACREYQAALNQALDLLNHIEIPVPPASMVNDVMLYIEQRETERELNQFFFPGLAILKSIQKTWVRYFPLWDMPMVLQREAWPTAIATVFIVFGIFLSPLSEPSESQKFLNNPVVLEVNSVAAKLRQTSDTWIGHVAAFRAGWFGEAKALGGGGAASPGSESIQMLK
ncbi:MAG: hypothetical protein RBU29_14940 [bacterium]|jgi:hypothetical protein|nr:hypothetical protein [bacterium]